MIYSDLVDLIGIVPEGYEWIYAACSGAILVMYVYTFLKTFFALFDRASRGRY